ncbi:hypothetical protein MPH_06649 [Macrophomina phaseolina MS6]|uniref:DUF2423 domain-containing protein n=1 Tax=Macrophomina phaseolina (strain MS6) TaxID=1126212 RepID=K2RU23_MACPH|nr:hypothetical protein MPH_06649 [Macrophomina phaseolina MS6]
MAKGARSSVRKTNNQALKARVFGPVETARTERLSQKLLELAQQPRPPKSEMEVEKDGQSIIARPAPPRIPADLPAESENTDAQEKAPADQAEGSSKCISWSIPPSLLASTKNNNDSQRTPEEDVFFHLLGLSGDIVGFTALGDLSLRF